MSTVIVGLGLMGGSLARALRVRYPEHRIIGTDISEASQQLAIDSGIFTEVLTPNGAANAVPRASMVVICSPRSTVVDAAAWASMNSGLDTLITDVCSVKKSICFELSNLTHFIGSHPIVGSHAGGFENSTPDLFFGRTCVVTPTTRPITAASLKQLVRLRAFWTALGMSVEFSEPKANDISLAIASHLPQLLASSLALSGDRLESCPWAVGSSYLAATESAAVNPELWAEELIANREEVKAALERLVDDMWKIHSKACGKSAAELLQQLTVAADRRRKLT